MAAWSESEALQLIDLWGEEGVQEQLEGAKRNKHIYKKILKAFVQKNGEQCRAKMKKLKLDYRKIKDKHNETGRGRVMWKFYHALDAILGHRPAPKLAQILDTAKEPTGED